MDIIIENLYKSYGETQVLNNFSAVFPAGKITCIMGASGCGKTTLVHILLGLVKADSGTVVGIPEKKAAVFQEDRLCEDFTAVRNVQMVCKNRQKATEHLIRLGLANALEKPVKELSGGMRRRVAIARAIAAQSQVIVLDEPFKGLDESTKTAVISYVQQEVKGKTVILVTHDPQETEKLADLQITME